MSKRNRDGGWSVAVARNAAVLLVPGVVLVAACGADDGQAPRNEEPVAQSWQPLFWNPPAALVTEHVNWHDRNGPCGTGGRRACNEQGVDFLVFHRNYLKRLRDAYRQTGLPGAHAEAWHALPPEMKSAANGWTAREQAGEFNVLRLLNASGQPFSSLNEFGLYLENFYHNRLHGIAANAYGGGPCSSGSSDCIVAGSMSPKSTYFFKIHGMIEWHYERFIGNGDFNRDGHGDLIVRNAVNGNNEIRLLNQQVTSSTVSLPHVAVDGCFWYVGASGDFNFDSRNDIVWHGPGCGRTILWLMNGTTVSQSVELAGVNNDWRLIGSGDFTRDAMPDLVWRSNVTGEISIWKMNGTSILQHIVLPSINPWTAVAVNDLNDDGTPDLLASRFNSTTMTTSYAIQWLNGPAYAGAAALPNTTGFTDNIAGVGRFSRADRYVDFVLKSVPPIPSPKPVHHFFWLVGFSEITSTSKQLTGTDFQVAGPL